jgi:hypothetical protein
MRHSCICYVICLLVTIVISHTVVRVDSRSVNVSIVECSVSWDVCSNSVASVIGRYVIVDINQRGQF